MSKSLNRVAKATAQRDTLCAEGYDRQLQAILAARAAGHTLDQIGAAAGITKQGVRYLITRQERNGA
jgi:hypothetical protein